MRTRSDRCTELVCSVAFLSFIWTCLVCFSPSPVAAASLKPTELRCEYAREPLGVDVAQPRLFWKLESTGRGARQAAFQILTASSPKLLAKDNGDLWDSGKVLSGETIHIRYAGQPLKSSQQVFWKVRAWDAGGKVSAWSKPASWTMGVLNEASWQAHWITSANTNEQTLLLRREFTVKPGLKRALVNVCGLGEYELTLNGRKAGGDFFPSGWTKFNKTCLYDTRDITALLRAGKNAVGLNLAGGMYRVLGGRFTKFKGSFGPLQAIAQIRCEYADGSVEIFGTDASWRVAPGPITFSCMYGGEDYDARLEPRGWNAPGFDDSQWSAAVLSDGPGGKLRSLSCAAPPITAHDVLKPVKVTQLTNGMVVYDFGQNASLMARFTVRGPAGSSVKFVPAEIVGTNGFVDRRTCGSKRSDAYWKFTLAGRGDESWASKFFYHGARYLQAECLPATNGGALPVVEKLEGVVVHSASEPVGEFVCSNELFNRIRRLVRWAQRSNMMSVMTDCPHREKLGWLEQYHLNGPSLRYEFDLAQLFTKGMNDMQDSQLADGLVPTTAPEYTIFRDTGDTNHARGKFGDSPEWSSSFLLVPWQQYEFDGDLDLFREYYDDMKRYVAYLGSRATNHIVSHGLGDWYDLGPRAPGVSQLTPIALTATAFYFQDAWILARVAELLGKADDAKQYSELAEQIRTAFNRKFFDATNRTYATGSQCANSIPLVMGLVEPANRAAVLDAIVADVRSRGNALTAGDVGYRYLLRALAGGGRSDVIFDINDQSEKPGYGYQLRMGATSLTEAWDARTTSSHNHFMLGQITEWFYHDLAGIGCDSAGPGFKRIVINPQPVGDVKWVKASFNSIRGRILCDWKRGVGEFRLNVTIPANTSATVFLPAKSADDVTERGRLAAKSAGVKFLRQDRDRAVFEVVPGRYAFESKW